MIWKHWYAWLIFLSGLLSVASCGTGSMEVSTVGMRTHYGSAESETSLARDARIEQKRTERFFLALTAQQEQALQAARKAREPVRAAIAARPAPKAVQPSSGASRIDWDAMAQCESGGRWNLNSGNGYYGGLQFGGPDWLKATDSFRNEKGERAFPSRADLATREQQIQGAEVWRKIHPAHILAWPSCARQLGYA